jgi:glycosyltransferase involved in cell wall biosynthesis
MHVLLIHQAFASPRQQGGTRHLELGTRFVSAGNDFTIVASRINYATGESIAASGAHEEYDGVRVLRAPVVGGTARSYLLRIVSWVSFMLSSVWTALRVRDVDVVMGTTPPILQALSAWMVAALKRKPLLLEVRDLWPEFAIDIGLLKNPALIWMARRLEMFLYRRAAHLLVNSPAYRDYLIDKGVPASKVSFIANGVDPSMFAAAVEGPTSENGGLGVRDEFQLHDEFLVTYAGAIGMANDLGVVLEAAHQLRHRDDIHFLIVGDGKERANLEARMQHLKLQNVTFAGSRPKSDMPRYLAASDACLATLKDIPMFRTTYPNKVFDYMAAARPIVLAIDGVIREVVEAANGGVCARPGNANDLATAVRTLADAPDRGREMGRRAREYVIVHFNRDQQAEEFRELMTTVNRRAA